VAACAASAGPRAQIHQVISLDSSKPTLPRQSGNYARGQNWQPVV
jgi:hypothetical protein